MATNTVSKALSDYEQAATQDVSLNDLTITDISDILMNEKIDSAKVGEPSIPGGHGRYVRQPYVPKPTIDIRPIVKASQPRMVAGHVRRRENKSIAAIPPPSTGAKKTGVNQLEQGREDTGGKDGRNPGKDRDDGDKDQGEGKGAGDGGEGESLQSDNNDESGDDYESAQEDVWPETIWNTKEEQRSSEAARAHLEQLRREEENALLNAKLIKERRVKAEAIEFSLLLDRRRQFALDGPGWCSYGPSKKKFLKKGYQLFAIGQQVWRVSGPHSTFLRKREEVRASKLEKVGWIWDKRTGRWYRLPGPHEATEVRKMIEVMPGKIPQLHRRAQFLLEA